MRLAVAVLCLGSVFGRDWVQYRSGWAVNSYYVSCLKGYRAFDKVVMEGDSKDYSIAAGCQVSEKPECVQGCIWRANCRDLYSDNPDSGTPFRAENTYVGGMRTIKDRATGERVFENLCCAHRSGLAQVVMNGTEGEANCITSDVIGDDVTQVRAARIGRDLGLQGQLFFRNILFRQSGNNLEAVVDVCVMEREEPDCRQAPKAPLEPKEFTDAPSRGGPGAYQFVPYDFPPVDARFQG